MNEVIQDQIAQILEEFVKGAHIKNASMPLLQARLKQLATAAYQMGIQNGARTNTKRNGS